MNCGIRKAKAPGAFPYINGFLRPQYEPGVSWPDTATASMPTDVMADWIQLYKGELVHPMEGYKWKTIWPTTEPILVAQDI